MSAESQLLMVLGMAAVTFGIRYPILALLGRIRLPDRVFEALKYVPPAVLTAIIVPSILMPEGQIDVRPSNAYLYAGVIAALIAWRTKNLLFTIILGMAAFVVWRLILGGGF